MTRVALAVPDRLSRAGVEGIIAACPHLRLVPDSRSGDAHLLVLVASAPGPEAAEAVRAVVGRRRLPVLAVLDSPGQASEAELAAMGVVACLWRSELTPERLAQQIVEVSTGQKDRLAFDLGRYEQGREHRPSGRERDVLRLLAEGMAVPEIAERLDFSERTVQKTLYGVTSRLALRNRTHAVAYAWRKGVL